MILASHHPYSSDAAFVEIDLHEDRYEHMHIDHHLYYDHDPVDLLPLIFDHPVVDHHLAASVNDVVSVGLILNQFEMINDQSPSP